MIPRLLKSATGIGTALRCVGALLVLLLLGALAISMVTGQFWQWRTDVWKERAESAGQAAAKAQANADSANAGAANATDTRHKLDAALQETRAETQRSVERIKTHAPAVVAPAAPVDADFLLELEAGDGAYRAAADRLLGAGAR